MVAHESIRLTRDDLVFDVELQITGIVDFGMTLNEILDGATLPPDGARLDVSWAGTTTGLVNGEIEGTDYLYVRPDRRFELHIHAVISTNDDARLALSSWGAATLLGDGTVRLFEYANIQTGFEQYAWINQVALRGQGIVDLATGKISLQLNVA